MRPILRLLLFVFLFTFGACDAGLAPPSVEPGLAGSITVDPASSWPAVDSVQGLWLFASLQYPLDSLKVITGVLIEPRTIFLYPSLGESLPYGADSVAFRFALSPGAYPYIGVIQQIRPELLVQNFRVVAMLEDPSHPGQPLSVTVEDGKVIEGLRIRIDFGSPPPQPFVAFP